MLDLHNSRSYYRMNEHLAPLKTMKSRVRFSKIRKGMVRIEANFFNSQPIDISFEIFMLPTSSRCDRIFVYKLTEKC